MGNPLKRGKIYEKFKKAGKNAGLKGIGVHTLRHTFATHLAMNRTPIHVIQSYLGHAKIETTMIYLQIAESFWNEEIINLDFFDDEEPGGKQ